MALFFSLKMQKAWWSRKGMMHIVYSEAPLKYLFAHILIKRVFFHARSLSSKVIDAVFCFS